MQSIPFAVDSAKFREQRLYPVGEPDANLEDFGNPGYFGLLGETGGNIASPKARVQFHSPKAIQSLFRTFETAVPRRGNIISLRGRRLIHTRWFYCG